MSDPESLPKDVKELTGKTSVAKSPTVPSGWGVIELDHGEDDFPPMQEPPKEDLEKKQARKAKAQHAVDAAIPSLIVEEPHRDEILIPNVVQQEHIEVDDVWDDSIPATAPVKKDEAAEAREKQLKQEQKTKQMLTELVVASEVPEEDMEGYAKAIYSISKNIAPPNREVALYFARYVNFAKTVEQAELFERFSQNWRERFLLSAPDERIRYNRAVDFDRITSSISGIVNGEDSAKLYGAFVDVFDAMYSMPESEENKKIFSTFSREVLELGTESNDPEQVQSALQIFNEVVDNSDRQLVERFIDVPMRYGQRHGFTEDAVRGFREKLLPAMRAKDPQFAILLQGGNIWGMRKDFGAADYLCHAYALKVTPSNINELLMTAREIPTTNLARLEQNRIDGLTLATPFGILRDFIHDQRPYVHEVINAMVHFYDTGDKRPLDEVVQKTDYFDSEERREALATRERYEQEVESSSKWGQERTGEKVKPIDILRRLDENTKPVIDIPPETSDARFNVLLQALMENNNQNTLQEALGYTNSRLLEMMQRGEVGIEPNYILAYAFLERKGFEVLQRMKYEDQIGAYKQAWFQSTLRFQELTVSPSNFNEEEFQQFLNQVTAAESAQAAYRLIFRRELDHIKKLSDKYKDMGKENRAGALWSGNITHELIGLIDLRPAETAYGKRHREESSRPEHERLKGD